MSNIRLYVLAGVFLLPVLIIFGRLVTVQVLKHGFYAEKASAQQSRQFEIPAKRGELYVEDNGELYPVALNNSLKYVYADPQLIEDPGKASTDLAPILDLDQASLEKNLTFTGKNRYVELKQAVDKEAAKKIAELKLRGVVLRDRDYRSYPEGRYLGI
jgi:cell division protein FtsI (penicillin-binding protein 3)